MAKKGLKQAIFMRGRKKPEGFMVIAALGIFAIMMVFGLSLQKRTMETYDFVRSSNNHTSARIISDSVIHLLEADLRDSDDMGYNTGELICEYFKDPTEDSTSPNQTTEKDKICETFEILNENRDDRRDITIKFEIKARAREDENLVTNKTLFTNKPNATYYSVPFPGTGDAGTRCDLYSPVLGTNGGDEGHNILPRFLNRIIDDKGEQDFSPATLDQIDYSCNWNKLVFGSSMTDRVAIPLYYYVKNGEGKLEVVNPFKDEGIGFPNAKNFVLRVRTPCKPCEERNNAELICHDPTVCTPNERYALDDDSDEIVVQWQLSGECKVNGVLQACTMIADPIDKESSIFESWINIEKLKTTNALLNNTTIGNDISIGKIEKKAFLDSTEHPPFLSTLEKPVLTLFLSNALISDKGKRIPYLEYQFLTDYPISNSSILMKAEVSVNGNANRRTLEKRVETPLIDFALQN